jgi:hypothetical protein
LGTTWQFSQLPFPKKPHKSWESESPCHRQIIIFTWCLQ